MSTWFDPVQRICRGDSPLPPVAMLIDFTLTSIAPGYACMAFEAGAQHANPMGTLHGGILCDSADAAMGMASASTLGEGETCTTLELTSNVLKPVWQATLQAIGRVLTRSHGGLGRMRPSRRQRGISCPRHQHVYDAAR